ncbi:threonylcarbamoyladenosine tRNA methylthiotransferase [Coccinella septempunctata]|uniref:threonylcarbamoyladenosine tRNA methylthiotransferase n=1 Tax=Coccinella septempunctata TaxID=41139 RepID=UPI001D05F49A|nr:threonylcarbamoyladenosine tRNA methylthiotransferase [Coccinella septempunctata]
MEETLAAPCSEIIDDIEDLVSTLSVIPKSRTKNKKPKPEKKVPVESEPIEKAVGDNIPGTQCIYVKTWGCAHNSSDSEYMAGQLAEYGYRITTEDKEIADLWLLNSCTVKNPAEDHFRNEINAAKKLGKHIIVSGCVPQGAPKTNFIQGLSIIGVQQIDRIVEAVEETLKGNTVVMLGTKKQAGKKMGGASLLLPKIRRNPLIEIIAINTGCLNECTYCKTKHARGNLGSYPPEEIVARAKQAFEEGVVEIWLTSEDTGTYGRDIGTSLPELLWKLVEVIPDGCRLRLGMTNPPYILEHLQEISKIMMHPKVYAFLHVPVQSGSDQVLADMKRQYCRADFEHIVNFLKQKVPGITIATDIICGFPTETEENFEETMSLCEKYKFPSLFINQFYPRPGTPAAKMPRIPAQDVKERTKRLTNLFNSYEPYGHNVGKIQEILVTEISHDKKHYVGHNKFYEQVLIPLEERYMGKLVTVEIKECSKFSMKAEPTNLRPAGIAKPLMKGEVSGVQISNSINKWTVSAVGIILLMVALRLFIIFQKYLPESLQF